MLLFVLTGCASDTIYYGEGDITLRFNSDKEELSGEIAIPTFDRQGLEDLTTVDGSLLVEQGAYAAFDQALSSLELEAWLPYPVAGLNLPEESDPEIIYTRLNVVLSGDDDGEVRGLIGLSGDDRLTSDCYPGDPTIHWEGQADGLAAHHEGEISGMTTWQTSEDCLGTQSFSANLEIAWDLSAERHVKTNTYDGWD